MSSFVVCLNMYLRSNMVRGVEYRHRVDLLTTMKDYQEPKRAMPLALHVALLQVCIILRKKTPIRHMEHCLESYKAQS